MNSDDFTRRWYAGQRLYTHAWWIAALSLLVMAFVLMPILCLDSTLRVNPTQAITNSMILGWGGNATPALSTSTNMRTSTATVPQSYWNECSEHSDCGDGNHHYSKYERHVQRDAI
jgi:hypothetical protein